MITTKTTALMLAMTVLGVGGPIAAMAQDDGGNQIPTATSTAANVANVANNDNDLQVNSVVASQTADNDVSHSFAHTIDNTVTQTVEATQTIEDNDQQTNEVQQEAASEAEANVCTLDIERILTFTPGAEVGHCT